MIERNNETKMDLFRFCLDLVLLILSITITIIFFIFAQHFSQRCCCLFQLMIVDLNMYVFKCLTMIRKLKRSLFNSTD